jgi:hypothetical protein
LGKLVSLEILTKKLPLLSKAKAVSSSQGIDCVKTCVIEFADFVDNANKVEIAFYDFAKKYGTSSAYTKGNVYRNMIGNKPIQATNYEQREYDNEFFDKLYVNYEFVKDELKK